MFPGSLWLRYAVSCGPVFIIMHIYPDTVYPFYTRFQPAYLKVLSSFRFKMVLGLKELIQLC